MDATTIPEPAPGPPQVPGGDRELYRRRQRRRAVIAWSALGLVVLFVVASIVGSRDDGTRSTEVGLMPAEMTAEQFGEIHKGQSETQVLGEIGVPGQAETDVEDDGLLSLFPPSPSGSQCMFWRISDAPDHLVRLCFGGSPVALEQKSVAAAGEDAAPRTLT